MADTLDLKLLVIMVYDWELPLMADVIYNAVYDGGVTLQILEGLPTSCILMSHDYYQSFLVGHMVSLVRDKTASHPGLMLLPSP